MADSIHSPSKFNEFYIHSVAYKVVYGHEILLSIVTPKALDIKGANSQPKRPLVVHFHGGFFVTGNRLFSPWFPNWLLELVQSQGAILVCPDYRLMPEATGLDILSDIDSFWSWLFANLESELTFHFNPILYPDFDRILVTGDSAGGYCAIQSILRHPELSVKAVIMPYPMLHLRSRHWTEKPNGPILGLPDIPYTVVENHLRTLTARSTFSSDGSPDRKTGLKRMPLALSIVQNGRLIHFFGRASELYPINLLPRAKKFPSFIWLLHGRQDFAVPFKETEYFVGELKKHARGTVVRFDERDGEHGFDLDARLSDAWMEEGVQEVLSRW